MAIEVKAHHAFFHNNTSPHSHCLRANMAKAANSNYGVKLYVHQAVLLTVRNMMLNVRAVGVSVMLLQPEIRNVKL